MNKIVTTNHTFGMFKIGGIIMQYITIPQLLYTNIKYIHLWSESPHIIYTNGVISKTIGHYAFTVNSNSKFFYDHTLSPSIPDSNLKSMLSKIISAINSNEFVIRWYDNDTLQESINTFKNMGYDIISLQDSKQLNREFKKIHVIKRSTHDNTNHTTKN